MDSHTFEVKGLDRQPENRDLEVHTDRGPSPNTDFSLIVQVNQPLVSYGTPSPIS